MCVPILFYRMSRYSLLLVIAQFGLIGFLLWNGDIVQWEPYTLIPQVTGVLIAIWGVLSIKIGNFNVQPEVKSSSLVTSGPFKWIRNPMYLGILALFVPAVILDGSVLQWMACILLTVVLLLKMKREEHLLYEHFGNSYLQYKENTWRLIPYLY